MSKLAEEQNSDIDQISRLQKDRIRKQEEILNALDFADKKLSKVISFDFLTFSNYEDTVVDMHIRLPFQRLHELYALPMRIMRLYWANVERIRYMRGDFSDIPLSIDFEDLERVASIFDLDKIDFSQKFPNITLKETNEPPIK